MTHALEGLLRQIHKGTRERKEGHSFERVGGSPPAGGYACILQGRVSNPPPSCVFTMGGHFLFVHVVYSAIVLKAFVFANASARFHCSDRCTVFVENADIIVSEEGAAGAGDGRSINSMFRIR